MGLNQHLFEINQKNQRMGRWSRRCRASRIDTGVRCRAARGDADERCDVEFSHVGRFGRDYFDFEILFKCLNADDVENCRKERDELYYNRLFAESVIVFGTKWLLFLPKRSTLALSVRIGIEKYLTRSAPSQLHARNGADLFARELRCRN